MKNLKHLHCVLTVIAICLITITFSVMGLIPKANASSPNRFVNMPINTDGSINVRIEHQSAMPVSIEGSHLLSKDALPICIHCIT